MPIIALNVFNHEIILGYYRIMSFSKNWLVYFECIDMMVNAFDQLFHQPSFAAYLKMESFRKALNFQDNSTELQFLEGFYADDVNIGMFTALLELFKVLIKGGDFVCFS